MTKIIFRKKQNRVINTGIELGMVALLTLIFLTLLLLTGCTSTYTSAEERCQKAGLQVDKMKVGEQPNKTQEVIVECSKYPRLLKKSN